MPRSDGFDRLRRSGDFGSGEHATEQLERLWQAGSRPDVREIMDQLTDPTPAQIVDLLKIDQRHRWQSGAPVSTASYLDQIPGLQTDPEAVVDLIWSEYQIRQTRGEGPRIDDYISTFPLYESRLRRRHEASGTSGETESIWGSDGPFRHDRPDGAPCPFELPGFEVLREVGRGGMGIVYKARQISLDRAVALKVLPPGLAADPVRLRRFHNEAMIASRLTDSRILPVYDILEAGGAPVLVMPFVDGWDLGQILGARKAVQRGFSPAGKHPSSTVDQREFVNFVLPLLDQIVDAVAAIHEAGVIHRDIKPSNVLVDRRHEARLTDFGLARLGGEAVITADGQKMGTAGFMSPEQWAGEGDIDARADVFGLGAMLYQALTLELPYGKRRITRDCPPAAWPGKSDLSLAGEFDAVILKALEPERGNRYASAVELREDWHRVRNGLAPRARRPAAHRRLLRWVRQHPWSLANLGGLSLVLSMAGLLLTRNVPVAPPVNPPIAVVLNTRPPEARFAVVPIDASTGEFHPELAVRQRTFTTTPARLHLRPGNYLVVVQWPDGRFHEVYRHVPYEDERLPDWHTHRRSRRRDDVVELPTVISPPEDVLARMVLFDGGAHFRTSLAKSRTVRGSGQGILPFYLDQQEATVTDYHLVSKFLPPTMRKLPTPGPNDALRYFSFDDATQLAERMGKRLPDEAEYEFAATGGGTRPFPGADPAPYLQARRWSFGPVGEPAYDRTPTDPPVFGLYSNVAEWTSSWFLPTPRSAPTRSADRSAERPDPSHSPWPVDPTRLRVIRGGPASVVMGNPDPSEFALGPKARIGQAFDISWPAGAGFRGARSKTPRFLDDDPPQGTR